MNILELREKRAKIWEGTKAFLESHRGKDGILSAEDDAVYNKMMADIDGLGKEIQRLERQEQLEKEMTKTVNTPITNRPGSVMEDDRLKPARARRDYSNDLIKAIRTNFKQVSNLLREGIDTDGGYLLPTEYDSRIISALQEDNIMRRLGTAIPTSCEHKINIAATKPTAAWIDEGAALTFSDAKFGQILLDAHKLHVAIKITEELLYDNVFDLENYIITEFGKAMANAEEEAFLNGNGVGKPLGIFAENGGGTTAGVLTTAIKSDDMLDLIYALKRPYRKNAKFIMGDRTLLSLRKLKDNNGNYMWQPSYQVGEPDKILGFNVLTSAYAPATSIAFGDMSYYNIGDRGTRSISELRELFAGNGMVAYVVKERVDGKLVLSEAVQILKAGPGPATGPAKQ